MAHAVKEKKDFLLSLPTLSNQDRELKKEVVWIARGCAESRTLLFLHLSLTITAVQSCDDVEKREGIANCKTDRK